MLEEPEDIDARLARLSRETSALRPNPGFQARVRAAVGREKSADVRRFVVRGGWLVLSVAAVVALGTTALAIAEGSAARTSVAVGYGIEEPEW